MKFGFAQAKFTPSPASVFLDGFGERITPAEGVRDDLYVKTFVIVSDSVRYALAVFDACGFTQRIVQGIKRRIALENALSPDQVTVCTTHTHSAPASGVLGDLPVPYFWWDSVGEIAARTVRNAFDAATVCRFSFPEADGLSQIGNRRGQEACDRTIRICSFYDEREALRGVLVLAACHATCYSGQRISADYPAVLTRRMQEAYSDVPVLFIQGRGADVDPDLPPSLQDEERLETLGGELAEHVLAALARRPLLQAPADPVIRTCVTEIPMQPYAEQETLQRMILFFEQERRDATDVFHKRRIVREIYWHQRALGQNGRENFLQAEIQVLCLSREAVFVFLPFEVFAETGALIEAYCASIGYDPRCVFVVGHANGTQGYLVPQSEFSREDYAGHDMEYWYRRMLQAKESGVKELIFGHYEIINAPHWYDLPQCCERSEPAVLESVRSLLSGT